MKKLLLTYGDILHYRIPFFNELGKHYDLTVLHTGNAMVSQNDKYKEIIHPVKKIGPFFYQQKALKELRSDQYDIIIAFLDVRWLNTIVSIFMYNRKAKFIWWGAWITKKTIANKVRLYLTKKADSNIFYTNEAKQAFIDLGCNENNLFVANNTFDVGKRIKSYKNKNKNKIIFVGSLEKRKENKILINAFSNIIFKIPKEIQLIIIGDGDEKDLLTQHVHEKALEERIIFTGRIYDPNKLKDYYKEAIVSVSFGQAGLSVLQSLGFGVPFITKINAISGGEKSNIKHNINGIICEDNIISLENSLIKISKDILFARELGKNAYEYYNKYCTIENMVQGFRDAIENTKLAKIDMTNNLE